MRRFAVIVAASALLIAGCTADRATTAPTPRPQVTSPSPQAQAACPASAEISAGPDGLAERQGAGTDATLWALFFANRATVGQEIKVVWRMTGAGDLTIVATSDNGKSVKPVWGPEIHGGSTFHRPGDEWGTGWVFPTAGCWTVKATRTTGRARMVIRVR